MAYVKMESSDISYNIKGVGNLLVQTNVDTRK